MGLKRYLDFVDCGLRSGIIKQGIEFTEMESFLSKMILYIKIWEIVQHSTEIKFGHVKLTILRQMMN